MKTIQILIAIVSLIFLGSKEISNCNETNLPESNGLKLKIHGRNFEGDRNYNPSFFHQCVTVEISNPGKQLQDFSIPAGVFLMPDNPHTQRLMVTKSEKVRMEANSTKKINLYAMCTQSFNSSPKPSTKFSIGSRANEALSKLAVLIEKNNYQNSTAQNAVWALCDNSSQSSVYDEDTMVTFMLRKYIAEVRHEDYLAANSPRSYNANWFKPVNVKYNYYLISRHKITMRLYTPDSRLVETICEDSMTASGNHEYAKNFMIPQSTTTTLSGLKLMRWQDDQLVDIRYFLKADSSFTRQ